MSTTANSMSTLNAEVWAKQPVAEQTLADANGAFATSAGRQVYYVTWGTEGEPLVLTHGFGSAGGSWGRVGPLLAAAGYTVYAVDLGGFGLSDKSWHAGYDHDTQADVLAGWMHALGLPSATIVGHSMGGSVAARLALRHPALVRRLVLEDATLLSGLVTLPRVLVPLLALPPLRWLGRRLIRRMVRQNDWSEFEARNPQVTRVLRTADWDLALLAVSRDSWANRFPEAKLPALSLPTLLLWGADDTTVAPTDVGRLQTLLPQAEARILAGLGHTPHEEDPERFVAALLPWLHSAA